MPFLIHSTNSKCLFCVGLCVGARNEKMEYFTGVLKRIQPLGERDVDRWLTYKMVAMVTQKPRAWMIIHSCSDHTGWKTG